MFRKPIFWILLSLAAAAGVLFAVKYFSAAFPIVSVDVRMNRQAALRSARDLAKRYPWEPQGYQQAAAFDLDREVQNYVELEAGGKEAFGRMLKEGFYSPYQWIVRHFKEGTTHETRVRFTPQGNPYGFVQKLPESEPGARLAADAAQRIAEKAAVGDWQINLNDYQLVEQSQEVRPSGRVDHTFVYERPQIRVGDGRYRLRLVVGGDRLVELTHFVKIPEAFSRRYEEMRSANIAINIVSIIAMVVLYVIGGCVIGFFLLLRQRWVLWREPLFWGVLVAFLQLLAGVNQFPLTWMSYDTALSAQGFLVRQIGQLLVEFLGFALLFSASFMAAESLSRRAFPHHIQFWRLWSPGMANSKAVLGRTVAGYLLVGLFIAFDVVFYFFTTKLLGWWTPSDALIEPNVLATYLPWLSPIAVAFQAGFWEESLFRAVPIAGAAIIGEKLGHRRLFIVGAMMVQALVFGAGHAGYANQPAYARLVELILPSFGFGLLYIYFGLLPGIVVHFTFDTVWMSLPLFLSSTPGIWFSQMMVIILALIPVWIVLVARLRSGRWSEVGQEHYNRSWVPPTAEEPEAVVTEAEEPVALSSRTRRVLLAGGSIGLVVWVLVTTFRSDAPPLNVTRTVAESLAIKALSDRGVNALGSWRVMDSVQAQPSTQDRFVWQVGGKPNYKRLMGTYLSPPHWALRFARFEGDVAERAEEYMVFITGEGTVFRVRHQLPEAWPGPSLSEEQARTIAHTALRANLRSDPASLKEVSAVPSKRQARRDWAFTFSDPTNYPLKEGDARIGVLITGDEVADAYRYVHVPEDWARRERSLRNIPSLIGMFCNVVVFALIVAGVAGALVNWSRKRFPARTFLGFFVLLFGLNLFNVINSWPGVVAGFSTAQPFMTQAFEAFAFRMVASLFFSAGIALVVGLVRAWDTQRTSGARKTFLWGIALGALVAGLLGLASFLAPSLTPVWAKYDAAGTYVPALATALSPLVLYIVQTALLLFVFAAVDRLTHRWRARKILFSILLVFFGLVIAGLRSVETLPSWFLSGLITGGLLLVIYIFLLQFYLMLVPLAVATIAILSELKQGIDPAYPGVRLGVLLAIVLIGLMAFYWCKRLARDDAVAERLAAGDAHPEMPPTRY